MPGDVARLDEVGIDGVVFAFAAGLSIVVGLVCAAGPAFQQSQIRLVRTLNTAPITEIPDCSKRSRTSCGHGPMNPRRAYGHLAIPSRRFSVAARSQSWCSRIR